ncbi:MAG TPA: site-2 protease family protein [Opitutaceae bacterium]|nr:site-2 protease family protein [Opitutaceae bacterium]
MRGIRLDVHVTFLAMLAYVAYDGWREQAWLGALVNILTMAAFFTCVVLHELGHSFTARAFGVKVPRILLLPIGGMAQFDSVPRRPAHEILIALAGPAVNAAIVAILAGFVELPSWRTLATADLSAWQLLLVMNIIMGTFNLLPVFPMDGGRVLRAALAAKLPYLTATRWAVNIGKVLAVCGIIVMTCVFHHMMGGILFLFILFAGELEYRHVLREETEARRWEKFLQRLYALPSESSR